MKRSALLAALLLAACSGRNTLPPTTHPPSVGPQSSRQPSMSEDSASVARDAAKLGNWPVKIGKPYQVAGITYYPADDRAYREEGVASWYGPGFHAGSTANGERYDQDDLTAAHRTLPMPSWVKVENLDNGRVLTVRVNDRGPFARSRIIDLSRKSAQLLGIDRAGTARVRLTRVFPAGPDPLPAVVSSAVPPANAVPFPVVTTVAVSNVGEWVVQVAALADAGRAAWLSGYIASFGPVLTQPGPNGLTRVQLGPFATEVAASAALAKVRSAGYGDARLISPRAAR